MAGPSSRASSKGNATFHFVNVAPTPDMLPEPHQQREIRSHVMKQYKSKIKPTNSKNKPLRKDNVRITRSSQRRDSDDASKEEAGGSDAGVLIDDDAMKDADDSTIREKPNFHRMQLVLHQKDMGGEPVDLLRQGRVDPFRSSISKNDDTVNESMGHCKSHPLTSATQLWCF